MDKIKEPLWKLSDIILERLNWRGKYFSRVYGFEDKITDENCGIKIHDFYLILYQVTF